MFNFDDDLNDDRIELKNSEANEIISTIESQIELLQIDVSHPRFGNGESLEKLKVLEIALEAFKAGRSNTLPNIKEFVDCYFEMNKYKDKYKKDI